MAESIIIGKGGHGEERHAWGDHFQWQGLYLVGKTATGRTIIRVLSINSEDQVALRSS